MGCPPPLFRAGRQESSACSGGSRGTPSPESSVRRALPRQVPTGQWNHTKSGARFKAIMTACAGRAAGPRKIKRSALRGAHRDPGHEDSPAQHDRRRGKKCGGRGHGRPQNPNQGARDEVADTGRVCPAAVNRTRTGPRRKRPHAPARPGVTSSSADRSGERTVNASASCGRERSRRRTGRSNRALWMKNRRRARRRGNRATAPHAGNRAPEKATWPPSRR